VAFIQIACYNPPVGRFSLISSNTVCISSAIVVLVWTFMTLGAMITEIAV
jgi:hypothetical protein